MKGIKNCVECVNYDFVKHKCNICENVEGEDIKVSFYANCPLPDVVEIVKCHNCTNFDAFENDNRGYCEKYRTICYNEHYCGYGKNRK